MLVAPVSLLRLMWHKGGSLSVRALWSEGFLSEWGLTMGRTKNATLRIVGAAMAGALGAWLTTAVVMRSVEFAIFAAIGGAVATAIAAAIRAERAGA
jgi:hypothetical protein